MDWNIAGISLFIVAVKKKIVKVIVRGVLIKKKQFSSAVDLRRCGQGLTCLRRSLVFLVILSMAEFRGSPFSFLPVCKNKNKKVETG